MVMHSHEWGEGGEGDLKARDMVEDQQRSVRHSAR